MRQALWQLGLSDCRVCGSSELVVLQRPVVLTVGAILHSPEDVDGHVLYLLHVECHRITEFRDSPRLQIRSRRCQAA
jgi:hypothetical protein